MPAAEAHVATDRASRYLAQLCSHLSHMTSMRRDSPGSAPALHGIAAGLAARHGGGQGTGSAPLRVEHVDHDGTYGSIRFTRALCTLRATGSTLTLRIDAEDENSLRRVQDGLAGRLEKIGRRDNLTVTWQRPQASAGPPAGSAGLGPAPGHGAAGRLRARSKAIALVAGGALLAAMHLGLLGATPGATGWVGWGVNGIMALIVLKLVFMGSHVVLGRRFGVTRGLSALARRSRGTPRGHTAAGPPEATGTTAGAQPVPPGQLPV